MVDDIKPHIIGITESWANNDITDAELGLEGYAMFRKDRMGRRGGGVLLYIKDTIPAYEVQLQEEADFNEAVTNSAVRRVDGVLLLSCPSHNVLPLAGACLCPLCHCGQVVSRAGLV